MERNEKTLSTKTIGEIVIASAIVIVLRFLFLLAIMEWTELQRHWKRELFIACSVVFVIAITTITLRFIKRSRNCVSRSESFLDAKPQELKRNASNDD